MKKKMLKRFAVLLALFMVLTSGAAVNGYLTEDGRTASMIKLERVVSSTSSMVGKVETITYNLTGDTIVNDPPKEIALVVDVSGSMAWDVNGNSTNTTSKKRITMLKNAAVSFVEKWQNRNCKIAIVPFSTYVKQAPELIDMANSDCLTKLNNIISNLTPDGSTNIGDGMRVAYHTLNNSGNPDATKYIITLTDGEPNVYSSESRYNTNYYTGADILTSDYRAKSSTTKGMAYCSSVIGSMILNNDKFRSFVIGFATPATLVNNLNSIGTSSGAARLDTGNYFYYAGSQTELNQAYADISDIISSDIPFSSAVFSELLPEGTAVEPEAVSALEAQGFEIIDNYVEPTDPDHKLRTKISKSLSGSIFLTRKYPTATTAPQNSVYQLRPYSFTITVVYTTPGVKVYKDVDACVFYSDPFMIVDDIKYANTSESVSVIQPVSGIANTHAIVMPGQNESAGVITAKVLPDTAPNIAYDKAIASWTLKAAEDIYGNTTSPGIVVSIGDPDVPDPLNGIKTVTGKVAGKAYVEAVSAGMNLNNTAIKVSSVVYVVDGDVTKAHMNNGDQVNLNNFTIKYIPNTNTNEVKAEYMSFKNWRLKNMADAAFVTVEASGAARAIRPLENDVPVLVDVEYTVGNPGSPGYLHLTKTIETSIIVAQPVTGVTVKGTTIMAGSESKVTAVVMPADAINRKIKSWKLIDDSGSDVTSSSNIAKFTTVLDLNNCEIKVEGKNWGRVNVMAESEGNNLNGLHETGSSDIYVVDATCINTLPITLWGSGRIEPVSYIPTGLLGQIKYTFTSDNPLTVSVSSTGEVKGLQTTASSPVTVRIRAEYCDSNGNPTGQVKELTCLVSVAKPNIDIN